MNIPDIIGVEVLTPDGRGSILRIKMAKLLLA